MPHVGVGFHGADEHNIMLGGERGKLVAIPRARMFGDAQPAQAEPFGFENQFFGRQAGISAALGGVDM